MYVCKYYVQPVCAFIGPEYVYVFTVNCTAHCVEARALYAYMYVHVHVYVCVCMYIHLQ